jgi:hypothetical protein
MEDKHPVRVKQIGPDMYTFVPDEEVHLKVGKILGKLKYEAALGPCGLRSNHDRMRMGVFAPGTTDTSIENLEDLITKMANDKLPPWFMQVMQGAELLAIVKGESRQENKDDHIPVVLPNILSKVAAKAMLVECQEDYMRELLPRHVGVGVKFAAGLLTMWIKMTLHIKPDHILVNIDIRNAYNTMRRASIMERHIGHMTLRKAVPYWRAKLGPRSPIWAEDTTMWGDDGLQQGLPTSGHAFAFTIHPFVREADMKLEAAKGCV